MNFQKLISLILFLLIGLQSFAQDDEDYVEFNDRKNVVHGVYVGINMHYGEIKGKDTYMTGLKVAYVANQQFEVGLSTMGFYSEQNLKGNLSSKNEDLIGGYLGLHLEPIFFSKHRVNLSFPVMIGGGAIGYVDGDIFENDDFDYDNEDIETSDIVFVVEPGVNILFNVSRYLQLEAGVRYRISSEIDLAPNSVSRISGFSAGIGLKVGVFNLGRNRYKKKVSN
ncbi:hypothetical protein JQC67_12725 [Aurantibacter crassamenti]|uniref:hypothetical protein n=1 Tax=Aurantibacter crassamenti TaxID=1837375 RepID=UPI00193AAFFC|nr:hypothetical protein [Aurantibacter crassamenti]MBM1107008.1 hypothetical protein [Aurantibacter crassamenti]